MNVTRYANEIHIRHDRGECRLRRLGPRVMRAEFTGHIELSVADPLVKELEGFFGNGNDLYFFSDSELMTGWDSGFREKVTECIHRHLARVESCHVLVRSRIVAMGVSVSGLLLGGKLRAHNSRTAFESAMQQALGK
jgi:hypothetical protein